MTESVSKFREKGFGRFCLFMIFSLKGSVLSFPGQFLSRGFLFLLLYLLTNYLYIASLARLEVSAPAPTTALAPAPAPAPPPLHLHLQPTVCVAIFATSASFTYLLSWVVLHHKFMGVSTCNCTCTCTYSTCSTCTCTCALHLHQALHYCQVRIVAVILCFTGIALLAYMDGVQVAKLQTKSSYRMVRSTLALNLAILTKSLQCSLGFNCVTQTFRFPVVLPH